MWSANTSSNYDNRIVEMPDHRQITNGWKSRLYLTAGFICVGLGIAGIPTPLLPTTPFLLLAAFFFARSSQRWHNWLLAHRVLGPYIHAFRDKRGLTREQKWRIAGLITVGLLVTGVFAPSRLAQALAAFIWTTCMIFLYFTRAAENNR